MATNDSAFDLGNAGMGNTVTVTDDYVCQPGDNTIQVDTTTKNVKITLLDPNSRSNGVQVRVKKISTDVNTMQIYTPSGTIDGTSNTFMTNSTQRPSYTLEVSKPNYIRV